MRDYTTLARELDDLAAGDTDCLPCAVLAINIPRLDDISLEYGYRAGEQVISTLVEQISGVLRAQDSLSRIGSQEFSLLLRNLENTGQAILAAQKICDISDRSLIISGRPLKARINIGIAYYPHHGTTGFELIQKAGIAARAAADRKVRYCIYSKEEIPFPGSFALESMLHSAIENADITAEYQPIINLNNGGVVCFESLARWNSPELGFISPSAFVGMAERSSLIRDFTILTLNTTMRQYPELAALFPGVKVSINLSASLLSHEDTVDIIARAINLWNMPPECLELEITESAIMEDWQKSSVVLDKLNQLGIRIAIDDFGTGQASFKYLKQLPISDIKIDKSFIVRLDDDEHDVKIVNGIIELAHSLELAVVAEGIENLACAKLLRRMGCEYGQGYYFAQAMPIRALANWSNDAPPDSSS